MDINQLFEANMFGGNPQYVVSGMYIELEAAEGHSAGSLEKIDGNTYRLRCVFTSECEDSVPRILTHELMHLCQYIKRGDTLYEGFIIPAGPTGISIPIEFRLAWGEVIAPIYEANHPGLSWNGLLAALEEEAAFTEMLDEEYHNLCYKVFQGQTSLEEWYRLIKEGMTLRHPTEQDILEWKNREYA